MTVPDFLVTGEAGWPGYVMAHGAGAPMDSEFLNDMAAGLAAAGVRVVRFEFPYMAERRRTGSKKPPDRQPKLLDAYRAVVAELGTPGEWVIGGKSMGGRMASLLADELGVAGLVCLGYPFHPPGAPEKLRTAHLGSLATPALIVQGERDPFGRKEEVDGFDLDPRIEFCWLPDGDHSFKPRKRSGHSLEGNLSQAIAAMAAFVRARSSPGGAPRYDPPR